MKVGFLLLPFFLSALGCMRSSNIPGSSSEKIVPANPVAEVSQSLISGLPSSLKSIASTGICDRDLSVQEAILLALQLELGISTNCAAVNVTDLAQIQSLEIKSSDYNSVHRKARPIALAPSDLAGLDSLQELGIGAPFVKVILNKGVLSGLTKLEKFWLYTLNSSIVDENLFQNLPNLKVIEIQWETPYQIPEGLFQNIPSLEILRFYEAEGLDRPVGYVENLKSDAFAGSSNIQVLNIGSYQTDLPEGIFDSLVKLTFLGFHRNRFHTLPETLFDKLKSLRGLSFGRSLSDSEIDIFEKRLGSNVKIFRF